MALRDTPYHDLSQADAVAAARADRPAGCPLQVRANGQWAFKLNGVLSTLGSVRTVSLKEAMARYHGFMADVESGRTPRPIDADRATVRVAFDAYVKRQVERAGRGIITTEAAAAVRRYLDYAAARLGENRTVASLRPIHFEELRTEALGEFSPVSVKQLIVNVRSAFRWAYETGDLTSGEPKYGAGFKSPSKSEIRRFRATRGFPGGRKIFHAEEVRAILAAASPGLRAWTLCGISCGMLAADVAMVPPGAVDLERGWIDFPRPKSGVDRRAPIWPELAAAIPGALADQPERRAKDAEGRLFVSRRGTALIRQSLRAEKRGRVSRNKVDLIGRAFREALVDSGVRKSAQDAPGMGFAKLRRTFATVADQVGNRLAKNRIMGHVVDGLVDDSYVDTIDDARLVTVSNHVRSWLFGESALPWPAANGESSEKEARSAAAS